MQAPGFWDDQERAAKVSAEHASVQRKLNGYRELEQELDDIEALEELAQEDDSIAGELDEQRESFATKLADLEEARLFSGRYDAGDAVVSVHAGAGGTDSQDWAEMLLRMEMRWAERRNFNIEMVEASPGEETGIKSATFIARGENAYGLFSAEHASLQRKLNAYRELEQELDDIEALEELAQEDESITGELDEQRELFASKLAELEEARLFSGRYDAGDAVVSVHAGAGGTDSQDWAEMLLRMEMRWAERRGFKVEMVEASPGEETGIKSATFIAHGENAYGLFSAEKGVHRLVRISPFDSQSRRHTSFALVEVSPLVDEATDVEISDDDLQIDTYRASGAGGQHVNKTDSAVRITHLPTGIVVQCQNERSQISNKQTALRILKSRLVELQEEEREAELARERGVAQDTGFGSQIRSYVLQPYQLVKDLRTNYEVGNAQGVLDGNLDGFVREYLLAKASGKAV